MSDNDDDNDIEFQNRSDSDFYDHDGQAEDEGDYEAEEEEHLDNHIDQFESPRQEYEEMDMSFERNTDLLTKVKARIMFNINKERQLE